MPLLGFRKQWFHPDLALVHGLLVRGGLMISLDPFQVGGVKRTVELPTTFTGGTLRFAGTGITGGCTCTVFSFLLLVLSSRWEEELPLRAKIAIVFSIIRELRGPIIGRHVLPIGQGDVGSN